MLCFTATPMQTDVYTTLPPRFVRPEHPKIQSCVALALPPPTCIFRRPVWTQQHVRCGGPASHKHTAAAAARWRGGQKGLLANTLRTGSGRCTAQVLQLYLDDVLVLAGERGVLVLQGAGHLGARGPDAGGHGVAGGQPSQKGRNRHYYTAMSTAGALLLHFRTSAGGPGVHGGPALQEAVVLSHAFGAPRPRHATASPELSS